MYFAAAMATVAGFVISFFALQNIEASQLYSISGTMATISGSLLGFLIAALSILSTVIERRLLVNLKRTGHYDQLVKELFSSSVAFLVVMVISLFCLFLKLPYILFMVAFSVAFMILAIWFLVVAGHHFYLVMINVK